MTGETDESDGVDVVLSLLCDGGGANYSGEPISQLAHAEQAAAVARFLGAPDTVVAAALLHDVGHLLHDEGEDVAERGIDTRHEDAGARWLGQWFGPEVTEPVRLHVVAKRYLCATDPAYLVQLSPASLRSLELQGGPLDVDGLAAFEAEPFAADALVLRRADEAAKVPDLVVPPAEAYRVLLQDLGRS